MIFFPPTSSCSHTVLQDEKDTGDRGRPSDGKEVELGKYRETKRNRISETQGPCKMREETEGPERQGKKNQNDSQGREKEKEA